VAAHAGGLRRLGHACVGAVGACSAERCQVRGRWPVLTLVVVSVGLVLVSRLPRVVRRCRCSWFRLVGSRPG
jgi:hypothetical protein